jgi:hypothetical protein
MSDYRVATGHNVALGSLTVIAPQPRTTGIQTTRRSYAASGDVYDEAKFIIFEFDFSEDATTYVALLTLFGVNVSLNANVTVYLRDERFAVARYNGIAVRPQPGADVRWTNYFPRNIEILVKDLAASS